MRELLTTIEQAVRERGWSARQASMEAVGSPELISNMRRGRVPSVDRFRALCRVLGLEFYVGRPREAVEVDEQRLELALEAAERGLSMSSGREMDFPDKAQADRRGLPAHRQGARACGCREGEACHRDGGGDRSRRRGSGAGGPHGEVPEGRQLEVAKLRKERSP